MKNPKSKRFLTTLLKAGALAVLLSSTASADWYQVKVVQIVPRAETGDVFVQLRPGDTENRFTGKSRGILLQTEPGTNKLMAVLLTAVALNTEITVDMANTPSWDTPQVIRSAGIVAPQ